MGKSHTHLVTVDGITKSFLVSAFILNGAGGNWTSLDS